MDIVKLETSWEKHFFQLMYFGRGGASHNAMPEDKMKAL